MPHCWKSHATAQMLFSFSIATTIGLAIGGVVLLISLITCTCCIYCYFKNKKARTPGGAAKYATNTNSVVGKITLIHFKKLMY